MARTPMQMVEHAMACRGFAEPQISPDTIPMLQSIARVRGWEHVADGTGYTGAQLSCAMALVMHDMGELFARIEEPDAHRYMRGLTLARAGLALALDYLHPQSEEHKLISACLGKARAVI